MDRRTDRQLLAKMRNRISKKWELVESCLRIRLMLSFIHSLGLFSPSKKFCSLSLPSFISFFSMVGEWPIPGRWLVLGNLVCVGEYLEIWKIKLPIDKVTKKVDQRGVFRQFGDWVVLNLTATSDKATQNLGLLGVLLPILTLRPVIRCKSSCRLMLLVHRKVKPRNNCLQGAN